MAWLIAGVVLFIAEMVTPGAFVFACFGLAALIVSPISCVVTISWVNWLIFLALSIAFVVMARPIAKRAIQSGSRASNVDELVGKIGVVTEEIKRNGFGTVRVGSEIWKAESKPQADIDVGSEVKVLGIDGTRLIVEKV